MPKHIALKIKKIRDDNNLSQDRFAKKIGLSGKTISAYETGRATPPMKTVEKINNVYGVASIGLSIEVQKMIEDKIAKIEAEFTNLKTIFL